MKDALIDLTEPVMWWIVRSIKRPDLKVARFGRCSVFGSERMVARAEEASRQLAALHGDLWRDLVATRFDLIEEWNEGAYRRHANRRFSLSRSIAEAELSDFVATWVGYYFWAKEIEGWSFREWLIVRPAAKESVIRAKAWMIETGYDGPVLRILDEYLSGKKAGEPGATDNPDDAQRI